MLSAYALAPGRVDLLPPGDGLARAGWIDLMQPGPQDLARVQALGRRVPSLQEMEGIEISNRLFREEGADYMTVVLPGLSAAGDSVAGPVAFILSPERLITVRHHAPRPFQTFPARAGSAAAGCDAPARVFLGLLEETVARLADILEGISHELDTAARAIFREDGGRDARELQGLLRAVGREGERLGRVRLALISVERALSHFRQTIGGAGDAAALTAVAEGQMRDVEALGVHADFLAGRITLATDSTLGMINLAQNTTVRIVSVVAALFLPPTLIASAYGMNFAHMPELDQPWGYPLALGLMLGSAVATYVYFKWRGWM